MKPSKSRLLILATSLTLLSIGIGSLLCHPNSGFNFSAFAKSGAVEVFFGTSPLFNESNIFPGGVINSKTFAIKNVSDSGESFKLYFASIPTGSPNILAGGLGLVIRDHTKIKHSGTWQTLFDKVTPGKTSVGQLDENDGILLDESFEAEEEVTLTFDVVFPASAGDEYQGLSTTFDGVIGWTSIENGGDDDDDAGGDGGNENNDGDDGGDGDSDDDDGDDDDVTVTEVTGSGDVLGASTGSTGGSVLGAMSWLPITGANLVFGGLGTLGLGLVLRKLSKKRR